MKWHKLGYAALVGALLLGSAMMLPATAQVLQDNVPGSFLVFPVFDIRSGNTTHIRITDTSSAGIVTTKTQVVHLNVVCPGSPVGSGFPSSFCSMNDQTFALSAHQTHDFDVAAELTPGCDEGYIVAYILNATGTTPIFFDSLIGSYHIAFAGSTGQAAGTAVASNAISIQGNPTRTFGGPLGTINPTTGDLDLSFGTASTTDYVALPKISHASFRATSASSSLELILLSLNIVTNANNALTSAQLNWWNEAEFGRSGSTSFVCWERLRLGLPGNNPYSTFASSSLLSTFGTLRVTAQPGTPNQPVLGAIHEYSGAGVVASSASANIRNLFHCSVGTCPQTSIYSADFLP